MLFKILPLLALIGIGLKFLATFAAVAARKKRMKAEQAGRLDQYNADRELFWRNVDRFSLVLIGCVLLWYAGGVLYWLFGH